MSANTFIGRIKVGASCFQDHHFYRWPHTHAGRVDPNTKFRFEMLRDGGLKATADGFGFGVSGEPKGKYGNGAIYVYSRKGQS